MSGSRPFLSRKFIRWTALVSRCERIVVCAALSCVVVMFANCRSNSSSGKASQEPGSWSLARAFPNLTFTYPVDLESPPDGSNRFFVVEQSGRILVFPNTPGATAAKVFLDIRSRVTSGGEMGLLGLAFHPGYSSNGYFYLNYDASPPRRTVIARFRVSRTDPDAADLGSEQILLEYNQPFTNHKGGQLRFGPDGYLYIAAGDGGSAGDPNNNAQNLSSLLGKILRIDVDATQAGKRYGIPSDNPFVRTSSRGEIWAYGLRNPWRFSFDPATGKLWAADVGQDAVEEIDLIQKGGNYGWHIMEGRDCFKPSSGCDTTGLVMPVWQYRHDVGNCIIGGFVYRGAALPELDGTYIYSDFGSGRIWSLGYDGSTVTFNHELLRTNIPISSYGTDRSNEMYLVGYDGHIYRLQK